MGFCCQYCGEAQESREEENKVVTHVRSVKYPPTREKGSTKVPEGFEIVREIKVCSKCNNVEFPITVVAREKTIESWTDIEQ